MRFDPADMDKWLAAIEMVPQPERGANVVDGSKNPELLLPSELFSVLLQRGFDDDVDARTAYRTKLEPLAIELEVEPDFWPTLAELASGLIPWSKVRSFSLEKGARPVLRLLRQLGRPLGEDLQPAAI